MIDFSIREQLAERREIIREAVNQSRNPAAATPLGFVGPGTVASVTPTHSSDVDEEGRTLFLAFTNIGHRTNTNAQTGDY